MDGVVEQSHGEADDENLTGGEEEEGDEELGLHLGFPSTGGAGVAGEPSVGMRFPTAEAARAFYCAYAARAGFAVRTDKSRRSRRDDSSIMRRFVCTREGFHPKKPDLPDDAGGRRKRMRVTVREGCMAMIEVTKKDSPALWVVTKFVAHHVHPVALPGQIRPASIGATPTGAFNGAPAGAFDGAAPKGAFDGAPTAAIDEEPAEAPTAVFDGAPTGEFEGSTGEPVAAFNGAPTAAFPEPTGAPTAVFDGVSNGGALFCNRVVRANQSEERREVQGVLEYLSKMQAESPGFFYTMQVDSSNCVTGVFWADTKARMAYKSFGDAVTFDTTYKKTKYMMPFAVFRGINHHLQGITFGCCLLMDETKGSYTWLFDTWLAAMGGRHPDLLVTDQGKAMEAAIARVLPNTRHRFC